MQESDLETTKDYILKVEDDNYNLRIENEELLQVIKSLQWENRQLICEA